VRAKASTHGDQAVIVIVSRRVFDALPENLDQPPAARWAEISLALPGGLRQRHYEDVLSGNTLDAGDALALGDLASQWCAVLVAR
jgi:(1->4)-alpha-D-glucan 1-alpha-D-glucosylmutase